MTGNANAASPRWAEPTRGGHSERLEGAKTGWTKTAIVSACPSDAVGFVNRTEG